MTPKDKSKELVGKMKLCLFSDGDYDAKQCALIAVDEILNNVMFHWYSPTKEMPKDIVYFVTQKKYYEEVRQEIEKL
jgi:hypothetical protein